MGRREGREGRGARGERRGARGGRRRRAGQGRAGGVRLRFTAVDYPPMHYELMLREVGVRVWGQTVHGRGEGGVRASLVVASGQKRWAEEVLFVQGSAVPVLVDELDPATVRRMGARTGGYTPRRTWGGRPQGPVGLKGRLIDFMGRFHGFAPRVGVRGIRSKGGDK